MVNTMLCKTLQICLNNPYSAIPYDEQYYTCPVNLASRTCVVSKGHYCSKSGGLCSVKGSTNCALASYFNKCSAIKTYYSIMVNTKSKTQ